MFLLALFDTVVLSGAVVHTMDRDAQPAVMTIVIENDRIQAVGPDLPIPPGAKRIDLSGMHVVPGLIDGMVNHDPDHDRLYIDAGVTLVRDVGNDLTRVLAESDRNARERSPGPWLWCSGAVIDGAPPVTTAAIVITSAAEAETKLKSLFEMDGIDFLSIHEGLPRAAWTRTIELAHARHKQVWGPVLRGATLADVLASKQDGLYYLEAFLPAGARWDTVKPEDLAPLVEAAGAAKLAITPTLSVYAKRLVPPKPDMPELEYLGPFYVEAWKHDFELRKGLVNEKFLRTGIAILDAQSKLLVALHDKGCRLVPGTGTPNPWLVPGAALLDELLLWKRAGLSSAEILRLATAGAAETIGAEKRGTITSGKIADLVVTKGDPAADLNALRRPEMVVLRGRVLDRAELDRLDADLAARQTKVKLELAAPLRVGDPEVPTGDVVLQGSVETLGLGTRVSAENYSVVRRYDGSLVYCGRVFAPGEATTPSTETFVQQTIQNGELLGFDVRIETNGKTISVHGEQAAGRLTVERRINGSFVDNNVVAERIAFVDAGSATALLILGYHKRPGVFKVIWFDDYEPAKGQWELRLDKDAATHLVKTPVGDMKITYDAIGGIAEALRTAGSSTLRMHGLTAKAIDGKGLPMPADKRAIGASAPSGKPGDAPAPVPPKKAGSGGG
jgi:hypothetical protein